MSVDSLNSGDEVSQSVDQAVDAGKRQAKQGVKVVAKKLGKKAMKEVAAAIGRASVSSAMLSTLSALGLWIGIPFLVIVFFALILVAAEDGMLENKQYSVLVESNSTKKENIRSFDEEENKVEARSMMRARNMDNSSNVNISSSSFNTVQLSEGNQAIENYHYYKSSESVLNNKMYIATKGIDITKKDKELFDELVKKGVIEYGGNEIFMDSNSLNELESQWKKDYGDVNFTWEDEKVKKELNSRLNQGISIKGFGDKYTGKIEKIDDERKKSEIKDAYGREEYFQLPEELLGVLNRKIYGESYIYDDPFVQSVKFSYRKKEKEKEDEKTDKVVNKNAAKNNYEPSSFNNYLKGELKDKGSVFIKYAKKYDVDAALAVSIACKESNYGENELAKKNKNVFGITKSGGGKATYDSIDEGIEKGIEDISSKCIGKGLTSLEQIGKNYNPSSYKEWAKEVGAIYKKITGKDYSSSEAGKGTGIDATAFRSVPDYEFKLDTAGLKKDVSSYGLGSVFIYKPSINLEVKRGVEINQVLKTSGTKKELIKSHEEDYKEGDKLDDVKGTSKDEDGNTIDTVTEYELITKDGVKKKKVSVYKLIKEYEATATAKAIEDVKSEVVYLLDKVVTFAGVYEFEYELESEEIGSENSKNEREVDGSGGMKEVNLLESKTIKMYEKPKNVKCKNIGTRYMDVYLANFKGVVPRHIVTRFNIKRMVSSFKGAKGTSSGESSSGGGAAEATSDHERVEQWRELVEEIASEYGMEPNLILTMIFIESSGDPHAGNPNYQGLLAIGGDRAGNIDTYEYMPDAILDNGPNDSRLPNCSGGSHNQAEHERAARFQIEYACKRLSDWMYRNTKYMYGKEPKELTESELALVALSAVGSYPAPYGQWLMMKLANKNYSLLFSRPGTVWQEYHHKADAVYGNMNSKTNSGYLKKFHENYTVFSGGASIEEMSTFETYDPDKWYVQNKNVSNGGAAGESIVTSSNGTNMNPEKVREYLEYERFDKVVSKQGDSEEDIEKKYKKTREAAKGTVVNFKTQEEYNSIRNAAIAMIKQMSANDITKNDEDDVFWGKGYASKYFEGGLQARPLYGDEMSNKLWSSKIREAQLYTGSEEDILDLARSYGRDVYVIIKRAVELRGAKYAKGKSGPYSFDHSGMLWYVFNTNAKVDYFGKGSVKEQYEKLTIEVTEQGIRPGDVIFYTNSSKNEDPDRVAIYLGNKACLGIDEQEGEINIFNYETLTDNENVFIKGMKRVIKYGSEENSVISGVGELPPGLASGDWLDPLYNSTYSGSSGFGMRVHPVTGKWTFHRGLDMAAPAGEIIYASREGTVIKAESYGTYGNCVIIDHGDSYTSLYAHMSAIGVKKGDIVKQGAPIGKVGSTGRSTGPHLHFEIAYNAPGHTSAKAGVYPEGNYLNPKTTVKGIK